MKKLLFLLSIIFWTNFVHATTYYISASGNNANAGTIGAPWRTLAYACANTSSGDIIHVTAGNYTESASCVLAVGVSIEGVGLTSHITSTVTGNAIAVLTGSGGTNGNQHISGIWLDGSNWTAYVGINVNRNNVAIYNCTVENFRNDGIKFIGNPPTNYITGCALYNCILNDNSSRSTGQGSLVATGFNGISIYSNTFDQTGRSPGSNGNTFSQTTGFYNKAFKFYNNISNRLPDEGSEWSFHLELWDCQGGYEIYNNEFHGGSQQIDFGGNNVTKGSYAYGADVHDNLFQFDSPITTAPAYQDIGVNVEGNCEYIIIRNNHFKNVPYAVQMTTGHASVGQTNTTIRNNLFENSGYVNNEWGFDIAALLEPASVDGGGYITNLNIYNNTFVGSNHLAALFSYVNTGRTFTNVQFINNIVQGVRSYGYLAFDGEPGTKTGWVVRNNLLYQNANSNSYDLNGSATAPSGWTYTANTTGNPLFVDQYKLSASSPAIDAGYNVGLQYCGLAPDKGYKEYGCDIVLPIKARFLLTNANNTQFQWESLDEDGIAYWAIEESTDYGATWHGFKNVAAFGSPHQYVVK